MATAFLRPAQPAEWTDAEMLERALRKEARAWAELVRRFRPLIYRCIHKVTGRHPSVGFADTDEIYAEVMVQLVREDMHKLRLYDPARGTKLSSWIGMLAINAAYDFLRGSHRRPVLGTVESVTDVGRSTERNPLDELLEKERWSTFSDILAEFTDKDRTFVELYFGRGLDADTVAAQMQISLKTVYSKKHKIRAHLARCLERVAGDSPIADLAVAA